MEEEKVTLCVDGVEKAYPKGTPYYEIAKEHQNGYQDDIVLVSVDNHLRELHKRVKKSGQITFVKTVVAIVISRFILSPPICRGDN